MILTWDKEKESLIRLADGEVKIKKISVNKEKEHIIFEVAYQAAYGLGEKFDSINQKGKRCENSVIEKFCNQGAHTYCPIPFFFLDCGLGVFAETKRQTVFSFEEVITCEVPVNCRIHIYLGDSRQILQSFLKELGKVPLPPKFAFGPWVSANHWNSQKKVEEAVREISDYQFPVTVMVLEAWSDEATFYIFNGAEYRPKPEGEAFAYEEFDFSKSGYWENPRKMIADLKKQGIATVLWQIPVYKKMSGEEPENIQNQLDKEDAVRRKLCVFRADGSPYEIPEGNWFAGSMIPDFTNKKTKETWFYKRRYLNEIGIAGYKTDGGEFIYSQDIIFHNGKNGLEEKNQYCQDYVNAYTDFIDENQLLFCRAGYTGAQTTPILWAGDHQSTNEELKNVFVSAMSCALSGIVFWSFDIAGFAGALPTEDLYRRSTQFACFTPVMQWHSEPDGGQFKELMAGGTGNNERSPWNMAKAYGHPEFAEEMRYWHNLRMNLLPYIYSEAVKAVEEPFPIMRPLLLDFNEMENQAAESEYLFGESLLVAPLLEENEKEKEVFLPEGGWYGFFSKKYYWGNQTVSSCIEKFPVFIREGKAVALQLPAEEPDSMGKTIGNKTTDFEHLIFFLAGKEGGYLYKDEKGSAAITWREKHIKAESDIPGFKPAYYYL